MGEAFGGRNAEPGRVDKGEQFQQIEAGKVGVTQPTGDQWRIHQQLRRVGGGHHGFAFRTATRTAIRIAQPGARVAGVKGGKRQGLDHRKTMKGRERKVNRSWQNYAEGRSVRRDWSALSRETESIMRCKTGG